MMSRTLAFLAVLASTTAFAEPRVVDEIFTDDRPPTVLIGDGGATATAESPVTIRLNDGQLATRYRMQTKPGGDLSHNTLQQLMLLDVTISFFKDKVRIDLQGSSGNGFDSTWDNTGVGMGEADPRFYLRRVSLTMSPVKGLELSLGSMGARYGAGSEHSYFDNDAYIMGYRAKVAYDGGDLVVTGGYVGDYKDPNVFSRFHRMDEFNYLQAILTHSIGEIVKASLDYTYLDGRSFARGAVQFDVSRWTTLIDSIVVEDMVELTSMGKDTANVVAARLLKRFKDLFAGRDLVTSIAYTYRTDAMDLRIGDKVFDGHGVRTTITVPDIVETGRMKLGIYADYVQSFSELDRVRAELGLILRF